MIDNTVHDAERLKELQALPLERKIQITQNRIQEFYQHFNGRVYVSFSGGKDSTVLALLARQLYPDIPLVYVNTGLEHTSVQKFVGTFDNVTRLYPEMAFPEVISTYGYPLISKEVAEAIYYARRIGGAAQPQKKNGIAGRKRCSAEHISTPTGCPPKRNADEETCWERNVQRTENLAPRRVGEVQRHRNDLFGRWQTAPMGGGNGGVFSSNGELIEQPLKSIYNKRKWLEAAQELPFMISHRCCGVMKKSPLHKYETVAKSVPILGIMAEESRIRKQSWLRTGCNAFDSKKPKSQPMAFWTEQDVLHFIKESNIKIADAYGDIVPVDYTFDSLENIRDCKLECTGCDRTGCVYCGFGAHGRGDRRFLLLAETDPRKYEYSMNGGQWVDNPVYDATAPEYDGEWKNWNPKKIWVPSKEGLGLREVFRMFNELYPNNKIKYE